MLLVKLLFIIAAGALGWWHMGETPRKHSGESEESQTKFKEKKL